MKQKKRLNQAVELHIREVTEHSPSLTKLLESVRLDSNDFQDVYDTCKLLGRTNTAQLSVAIYKSPFFGHKWHNSVVD